MVSAATDTAVSASISTPVSPLQRAVASMAMPSGSKAKLMSTPLSGT